MYTQHLLDLGFSERACIRAPGKTHKNADLWALPPEYLTQEVWVGPEKLHFLQVPR